MLEKRFSDILKRVNALFHREVYKYQAGRTPNNIYTAYTGIALDNPQGLPLLYFEVRIKSTSMGQVSHESREISMIQKLHETFMRSI